MPRLDVEQAVFERYSEGAKQRVEALCCPTTYSAELLTAIPAEVLERDYGCGDPSRFLREGETVLDLGSGSGKICFIASQIVGPSGRVIGVDINDDMLELARRNAPLVAERVGHDNVEFRTGRIQDMRGVVEDESIDVVVSNCVLNLVRSEDKRDLLSEIHRVLKPTGRAVVSDIVASADVPDRFRQDAELWSGCIAGAFREDQFAQAFVSAGLASASVIERQTEPWRVVEDIEFRSVTVEAHKGREGRGERGCCG